MKQNPVFLKWWIQVVVIGFAAIIAQHLGWWEALWDADQTKISLLILAVFAGVTALTGYISKENTEAVMDRYSNYVWFGSEAMISLGMIGTVAGFLMMLGQAFVGIDVSNTASMQNVIAEMALGMSTALSTTLVGLVCSVLVKLQMVIIENHDAELQE